MTPREILEALTKHELWLAKKVGGARADFSRKSLAGMVLSRAPLRQAKLAGANLTKCEIGRAHV